MGLGVLEDTVLTNVPGTSDILEKEQSIDQTIDSALNPNLKYDRSGAVPVLLIPQPTDDPNDPLNWPLWKRDLIISALSIVAVLCATTSSLMAANTVTISLFYGKSFTSTALLTGYHLCGVGVAGILIVPTARVWGKRHLFIIGNILMIVSAAWAGGSGENYDSLLWSRIFQGVALAPFEALVNACVGDLFFVHERGKRMALSNVALFGAAFLTPVLAGKITHSLGWEWTFYLVAIFSAACLPLTIFLVPETAFRRPDCLDTDRNSTQHEQDGTAISAQPKNNEDGPSQGRHLETEAEKTSTAREGTREQPSIISEEDASAANNERNQTTRASERVSYLQTLKPFNGRKTDENFFKLLLRPFPLFFHPAVLWACLIQGVIIGWTVFIGVVLAAIFLGPPLWFDEVKTGYLYTGAFIGSIIGLFLSGLLSDSLNRVMIKLNKGRYEPEFRILLVVFQLVFCGAGLYGFGIVSEDVARYGWLVADVFFALVVIGMVLGAVASALYIVDAHREITIESFTCMLIFKNMFSFVLTFFAYDWLVSNGVRPAFLAISSIQMGICLLSIPMYVFGKRNRSFFARHDILKLLHLW
ncbi:putative MFS transporter [Aspergillus candidus]|uniref:Synaptic vesicle transporter n=1 Tax=Aspergillus candidus TaxID=41067 RepID=A0A2I2F6Y9_ASPCN|nr:synaptic vesicle transporter [Aspergillus candidus]PLB36338.1 synaptic vesicle transporter [Aspergillus candidus]